LKRNHIKEVVVVGLAFDFCVGNTALDAVKSGIKATVVKEATKEVGESTA
jgi:nicotinamidase-related amidase